MPFKIRESAMMFTTGFLAPMQIIRWFEIVVKEYRCKIQLLQVLWNFGLNLVDVDLI
jgi:hypothetical protein